MAGDGAVDGGARLGGDLSPSTASLDRGKKREVYAKHGVSHVWYVDPEHRTLEVLALVGRHYSVIQTGGGTERGVFAPFLHEVDLTRLWQR